MANKESFEKGKASVKAAGLKKAVDLMKQFNAREMFENTSGK